MKYSFIISMLAVSLIGCGGGGGSGAAAPTLVPTPAPVPETPMFTAKIGDVAAINLDADTHVLKGMDSMPRYSDYRYGQALITADGQGLIKWEFKDNTADSPLASKTLLYISNANSWSSPKIIDGQSKVFMNQSGAAALVQNDLVKFAQLSALGHSTSTVTLPSNWPYLKSSVLLPALLSGFDYGSEEKMPNRILEDGTLVGFGQFNPGSSQPDQYGLFNYSMVAGFKRTPLENVLPRYLSPTSAADPTSVPRNSRPSIAGNGETLPFLSWCSFDDKRRETVILGALFSPATSSVFSSFLLAKVPSTVGQAECPDLDSSNGVGDGGNIAVAAVAWSQSLPRRSYDDPRFDTRLNLTNVKLTGGFSATTVPIANNPNVEISQYAVSTAPTGTTTIAWVEVTHPQYDSQSYRAPTRIAFRSYKPANSLTKEPAVLSNTEYLPLSDSYGNGRDVIRLVAGPQGSLAAVWARKPAKPILIANSNFFVEAGTIYAAKFTPNTGWTVPKVLATKFFQQQGYYEQGASGITPSVAINGKGQAIATFTVPAWCGQEYNMCKSSPQAYLMSSAF